MISVSRSLAELVDDVSGELQLRHARRVGKEGKLSARLGRAALEPLDEDALGDLDQGPAVGGRVGGADLPAEPLDGGGESAGLLGFLGRGWGAGTGAHRRTDPRTGSPGCWADLITVLLLLEPWMRDLRMRGVPVPRTLSPGAASGLQPAPSMGHQVVRVAGSVT